MKYGHKMTAWNGVSNYLSKRKLIGDKDVNKFRQQLGKIIHDFLLSKEIAFNKNPRYWDSDRNCILVQDNWNAFVQYVSDNLLTKQKSNK